jgi:transcriptional regulator with XRE-family HTH domain
MSKKFPDWLNSVLQDKGWSQSELARRAGVSRATVSDVLLGQEKAGYKLCLGIASALNVPPETVLQVAGLLPGAPKQDEKRQELIHLYEMMSEDNRNDQLDYARMKLEKQEREEKNKNNGKNNRPSKSL